MFFFATSEDKYSKFKNILQLMAIQDKMSLDTCKKIKRDIESNFETILLITNIMFLKEEEK